MQFNIISELINKDKACVLLGWPEIATADASAQRCYCLYGSEINLVESGF